MVNMEGYIFGKIFLVFLLGSLSVAHVLDDNPLLDGHNDLAYTLYEMENNKLSNFSFAKNLTLDQKWGMKNCSMCHTDLPRLAQGKVGAQFWSAFVDCDTQYKDSVARTLEQIDVIKRLVKKYPKEMQLATDADGIVDAIKQKRIASLIGVEGGHSIDSRVAVLRMYYDLGVRYLTLTQACNTPWAESSVVDAGDFKNEHNLTEFGKNIVREMNRLGMMVDLSHVSYAVMNQAINVSRAPVIFSHSSAFAVTKHPRNVHNDTLKALRKNKGIIMVNFSSNFVSNTPGNASIKDVIKHINYIADYIGVDSVGIGGDYNGVKSMPKGLEDVSKYPKLFDELKQNNPRRWTDENLKKLANGNFLRVFRNVELVRDSLGSEQPFEGWIPDSDLTKVNRYDAWKCRSRKSITGAGTTLTGSLSYVSTSLVVLLSLLLGQ